MIISRILHAGYIFESDGAQIIFDPLFENPFSKNCYAYPAVDFDYKRIKKLKPDAVFISHYHDDHCSLESLQYLKRDTPIYLYCIHEELFEIIRQLGFANVVMLATNEPIEIKSFKVTPRLALDPDVDSIFHITAEGLNILNVVDAWIDPTALATLAQTSWDMVLWPFQTMREIEVIAPSLAKAPELPVEWLEQLNTLRPKYVVPSSCQFIQEVWSWYRKAYFPISYKYFQNEVEERVPGTFVVRLNPGVSVELKQSGISSLPPLSWILPQGPQDIDYDFDPAQKVPATAEIARNFPKVSDVQALRVIRFCENELIEKYNELGTDLSGYWRLELYDHTGQVTVYCYELDSGKISLTKALSSTWVTEVPLIKLYTALEEGESLSSMYLRMQGMPFDDIAEDPLVASLFTGDFGGYQKNQLRKIRSQE